ncbi:TPA: hypothetical protein RZJ77_001284 [Campylobacter coli]|nr:hypothetical protein [Campylobacter coli]
MLDFGSNYCQFLRLAKELAESAAEHLQDLIVILKEPYACLKENEK